MPHMFMNYSFLLEVLCSLSSSSIVEVTCLSRRRNEDMDMNKGKMTVQEAGKKGGAKGGPRVRELIEEGKEHEDE
jgi:hypothetical protein